MTRPPPDPWAAGFRAAWVSGARLWSHAARRLITTDEFAQAMLGVVALHLCVKDACLLVDGTARVPGDTAARDDCPIAPKELRRHRERLRLIRRAILHLADLTEDGSMIGAASTADPPQLTITGTIGGDAGRTATVTRPEVLELLDALDPWVARHWERIVTEEPTVSSA